MKSKEHSLLTRFFRMESAGGILLFASAVWAMVVANSPLSTFYDVYLSTPLEVRIGPLEIAKPLLLWINDGLMALFFLLVGLELKREMMEGELSDKRNIILPGLGAIGGMVIPALIYLYFNYDDPIAKKGWAIPAATDIAFALGVLTLLGSKVPISIKIFLTSLAIFDDIGAILIIALFYTSKISIVALSVAGACLVALWVLNKKGIGIKFPYFVIGLVMWVATLKSGVHATLSGVLLAMFIPLNIKGGKSPLKVLEHDLHYAVAFFILPVFAFANAGLSFSGMGLDEVLHGVPVGISLGLFFGKIVGIFGICWVAIKLKVVRMPKGMNYPSLLGTAALCGIGFTMSLFIGSLAFEESKMEKLFDERLGIIAGSILSGIVGYVVLRKSLASATTNEVQK